MRRVLSLTTSLVILGLLAAERAEAQVTRADTAAVLVGVARDLQSAGHVEDARYLLRVITERYRGTPAAGEASRLLADLRAESEVSAGTAEFVGWHTALGATLGVLIPAAVGADETAPYGVGLLIGGPLGYGLSRAYSAHHDLSSGQALAIDYASIWGMIQFPMWQDILNIDRRQVCVGSGVDRFCYEEGGDATTASVVIGALSGVGIGLLVAGNRPVTTGTALSMIFASQWGLYFGAVGASLAQETDEAALAWTALGGNLGLVAAIAAAPGLGWSTSRTWLVQASGMAGLTAGFGVALIVDPADDETALTITAVGAGIGLAIGAATTKRQDIDRGAEADGIGLALLERRGSGWRVGVPLPQPGPVAAPAGSTRLFVPGLKFSLLKAVW